MKYLNDWVLYEAKVKKNWLEITQNKLKEFKNMVDSNSILDGWSTTELFDELLSGLKDVSGGLFTVNYTDKVRFVSDKSLGVVLTTNGKINDDFSSDWRGTQNPYLTWSRITKFLDSNRLLGKELDTYYVVEIYFEFPSANHRQHDDRLEKAYIKSEDYKNKWLPEMESVKEFLKSLGFEITQLFSDDMDITATIKLEKTDELSGKSLDLSDLVPANIVDDFERFIIKKNLSREDAEEISKIFIRE